MNFINFFYPKSILPGYLKSFLTIGRHWPILYVWSGFLQHVENVLLEKTDLNQSLSSLKVKEGP
jgi:hypothetical protein